jgi:hypothetical protein
MNADAVVLFACVKLTADQFSLEDVKYVIIECGPEVFDRCYNSVENCKLPGIM